MVDIYQQSIYEATSRDLLKRANSWRNRLIDALEMFERAAYSEYAGWLATYSTYGMCDPGCESIESAEKYLDMIERELDFRDDSALFTDLWFKSDSVIKRHVEHCFTKLKQAHEALGFWEYACIIGGESRPAVVDGICGQALNVCRQLERALARELLICQSELGSRGVPLSFGFREFRLGGAEVVPA